MKPVVHKENIVTVKNFSSDIECQAYMAQSKAIGYQDATVRTLDGPKMMAALRNNERCIFDDIELAQFLWQRIEVFFCLYFS